MKAVGLDEEIKHMQGIVEMYRNSWFVSPVVPRGRNQRGLAWAGDREKWRQYLCANKTLRRLLAIRRNYRKTTATKQAIWDELRKRKGRMKVLP